MKNTYTKKELTELFTTGNLEGLVKAMDVLEASKGYDDPLTIYAVELLNQLNDEIDELSSYEEDSDHMPPDLHGGNPPPEGLLGKPDLSESSDQKER